jgi:hypothetical protein
VWFLWAALSATTLASAYALATRAAGESTLFDRAATAIAAWFALIVCATWSVGALGHLTPAWLTGSALLVSAVACGLAGREVLTRLRLTLADDVREAAGLWRALFGESLPLFLLVAGATAVWLFSWLPVFIFKTWNYDATVYHAPLAHFFVQNASTERLHTSSMWMEGYPFAGSLIAVWNIVFPRDTRLDDASQMPTVVLLVSVTAAWLSRLGVKAHHALAFGCVALFMPTVFLQLPHGQVDLWCAGLFTLAAYQLVFRGDRASLLIFFTCMALYCATKLSGLLHLGLCVPLFAWCAWKRHRARGAAFFVDCAWGALVLVGLGLPRYIENALVTGDPTYPFTLHLPFGITLPGATEAHHHFGSYEGSSGALFSSPMAVPYIFGSWYHLTPVFWPDIRTGGFGWPFAFLLVPASGLVWLWWLKHKQWSLLLPLVWLALMALSMPTPWWGRYTLPAAIVGLVCSGWGFSQLWRWPKWQRAAAWALALSCYGGLGFAAQQLIAGRETYGWPARFFEALSAPYPESAALRVVDWSWTRIAALYREGLPEGALVIHDESADFFSEYFPQHLQAKVEFRSSKDAVAFAEYAVAKKAALVAVSKGSRAEAALKLRGWKFFGETPRAGANLYRPSIPRIPGSTPSPES